MAEPVSSPAKSTPADPYNPLDQMTLGPMTVRQWWAYVGTDNVTRVVAHMHTTLPYMRCIARRYKTPSYKFAKALVAAAHELTPGFAPDLELILQPLTPTAPRNLQRAPSPAYVHHQRYLQAIAQPTSVPPVAAPAAPAAAGATGATGKGRVAA